MKRFIQYYDKTMPIEDLAIELYKSIPYHKQQFGEENMAIYMDAESLDALTSLGIDCECVKTNFQPLDNHYHSMRWLSMMAMQTEPFQICPLDMTVENRHTDNLEVSQLIIAPFIPVLDKYGIPQTGGICGGDIISVPNAVLTMTAYASARDVIYDNEITDEAEIQQLMGAFLFKTAKEMNIVIVKYP